MNVGTFFGLLFLVFALVCIADVWFYSCTPREPCTMGRWADLLPGAGVVAYFRYRKRRHEYAKCAECRAIRRIEFMHLGICPMCRLNEAETAEDRVAALRDLGRELGMDEDG